MELQTSEVWRGVLLPRLQLELMRQQQMVLTLLDKGEYRQAHKQSGWVEALNFLTNLPVVMVRELEKKESMSNGRGNQVS